MTRSMPATVSSSASACASMKPKLVEGISCEKMTKASAPHSKPLAMDESHECGDGKLPRNYRPSSGSVTGATSKIAERSMAEDECTRAWANKVLVALPRQGFRGWGRGGQAKCWGPTLGVLSLGVVWLLGPRSCVAPRCCWRKMRAGVAMV